MANPADTGITSDSDDDARCKQAAQGAAARHATQAELDARLTCAQLQTAIAAAISADGDSNEVKRLTFLLEQKQIEEGVARQEKWRAEKMKERQEDRERLMRMEDMMLASAGGRGAGGLSFSPSRGGLGGSGRVGLSPAGPDGERRRGSSSRHGCNSGPAAQGGASGDQPEGASEKVVGESATVEYKCSVLRAFVHMGPFGVDAAADGTNMVASSLKSAEAARGLKPATASAYPQVCQVCARSIALVVSGTFKLLCLFACCISRQNSRRAMIRLLLDLIKMPEAPVVVAPAGAGSADPPTEGGSEGAGVQAAGDLAGAGGGGSGAAGDGSGDATGDQPQATPRDVLIDLGGRWARAADALVLNMVLGDDQISVHRGTKKGAGCSVVDLTTVVKVLDECKGLASWFADLFDDEVPVASQPPKDSAARILLQFALNDCAAYVSDAGLGTFQRCGEAAVSDILRLRLYLCAGFFFFFWGGGVVQKF